jgi:hypothetical protein
LRFVAKTSFFRSINRLSLKKRFNEVPQKANDEMPALVTEQTG